MTSEHEISFEAIIFRRACADIVNLTSINNRRIDVECAMRSGEKAPEPRNQVQRKGRQWPALAPVSS